VCLIYEVYDVSQGVHYSLVDNKCVETGEADVSYMQDCQCDECNQHRSNSRSD